APSHGFAKRWIDVVENGNADQKFALRLRQARKQRLDEIPFEVAAASRQRFDRPMQVVLAFDRGGGELQADWPAFGNLVQSHAVVQRDPTTKALSQNRDRFVELEAKVVGFHGSEVVVRGQIPRRQ